MSVGIQWRLSGTRSLPVMTAATPGILSALDVSMLLMRACAYGLRAMSRYSIPGSFTSSTYLPLPRMKRASSLRLTLCPMPPISVATLGLPLGGLAHLARRVVDGLHDVHVTGAAAEIPGDRLTDLLLRRRGVRGEEADRGHHHSRGAEPALQAVLLVEALLDRMELPILLESLDRGDARLIHLHREEGAGLHRAAVEQDGACAAACGVAADVGPGHPEVLAEEVNEQRSRLDVDVVGGPVHRHADPAKLWPGGRRGWRGLNGHG